MEVGAAWITQVEHKIFISMTSAQNILWTMNNNGIQVPEMKTVICICQN